MTSMSGFDKRVASYEQALAGLEDGMTLAAGGFGLCGIPENLIAEVARLGRRNLTVISNNCGVDDFGLGLLLNQARPAFNAWFGVMPEITPDLLKAVAATF